MNQVILIGRLARDVSEAEYLPSGTAVNHFTIATDRPVKAGEEKKADFIRITVFGRQAETCSQYLSKGKQVAVNGRIQTGSYKDKEGKTVYTTDVIANRVEFLGGGQHKEEPEYVDAMDQIADAFYKAEDDIPF